MKARKVSKKRKSSWRKHIDETDVDSFFEDKRLEERLGFVAEAIYVFRKRLSLNRNALWIIFRKPFKLRNDAELFSIDTRPGPLIRESVLTPKLAPESSSLRCFQGLENTSAVPDPVIKRFVFSILIFEVMNIMKLSQHFQVVN